MVHRDNPSRPDQNETEPRPQASKPRAVFPPTDSPEAASTWYALALAATPFILLHLLALFAFWTPLTWTAIAIFAVTYSTRVFGLTAGYHRYFAHKSYQTSRVFQFILACMGCAAVQKGPLWWAGHHRHHHRFSDTPQDPHSPHETSFWWSHIGWILSNDHAHTPTEDIQDFNRYPELRWLDTWHPVPGILLAITCYLIGGWPGLVWGFLISTLAVYHVTFAVNSVNHLVGTRRYATPDDSRNNWLIALLTFGEGWHNNHHHYQSSANQGFFWYEIDISYSVLVVLSWFGIVWGLRTPGERALNHRLIQPSAPGRPLAEMAAAAQEEVHGQSSQPVGSGPPPSGQA